MSVSSKPLGSLRQVLLESAMVTAEQLEEVTLKFDDAELGQLLVEREIITPQELAVASGLQLDIPRVDLNTCSIQPEALQLVPESIARRYNIIPLAVADNTLQVAIAGVDVIQMLETVASGTQMKIESMMATADEIREAIERNYKSYGGVEEQSDVTPLSPVPDEDSTSVETIAETIAETISEEPREVVSQDEDTKLGQLPADQEGSAGPEPITVADSQLSTTLVNLNTYQIQPDALQLIPETMARRYNIIPLTIINNALQVAMEETDNVLTIEALAARARVRIEPVEAVSDQIREAIDRNYKAYSEIEKQLSHISSASPKVEDRVFAEDVVEAPVVRALDLLINEAVKNRASDIHIEPQEDKLRIRYRIDGVLHDTMSLPLSAHISLVSRLKILANMNIANHHPQDGQFSIKVNNRKIDIRVATIHTAYGEMAVLRILDTAFSALSLSELGFLPSNMEQYEGMLKSPFGMILISGPTGSGKTTTLYASVTHLDCKQRNVITVEDPIEYRFKDINQIQVNSRAGVTFAAGLRAILRHDPDVILVGEIRDAETAEIAVQAALTGHLVLSSVHANDTVGALFRLLDLGVGSFLVSSALIGIVAQRMVRRVCSYCHQPCPAPAEAQLAYCKEMGEERTEFLYGSGCNACASTGYLGRIAVFEILTMSEEIKRLLLTGASAAQIRARAKKEGMASMWHDGMLKVKEGITTPDEVLRNVFTIG